MPRVTEYSAPTSELGYPYYDWDIMQNMGLCLLHAVREDPFWMAGW